MKKIKILHIITRVRKSGGAERNTLFTIQGLPRNQYEPHLIVGRDSDLDYARKIGQCKIYQEKRLVRNISPLNDFFALINLYRIIKKGEYDIVHTHLAKAGILGRLAAHFAKIQIIIHSLHGSTFNSNLGLIRNKVFIYLERLAGKYTDCFISVGKDLRDRYIKTSVGQAKKYVVIRSGMDLDKFYKVGGYSKEKIKQIREKFDLGQHDIVIGMVASLEPRKGHKYALEVAYNLPQVKFIFAGDGYLRNELEKHAPNNVKFLGFRRDIENVFAVCDIIILTSLWEGLPQVLVQAAACSKPIVSFAVEGAQEVIKQGINGFVVPIKDVEVMIDKIKYLISDFDHAKLMGVNGRNIISDEWLISTMVKKTISLYEQLINSENYGRKRLRN